MKVRLAYGQGHLTVELPDGLTTIIEPAHTPGLADERGAAMAALDRPSRLCYMPGRARGPAPAISMGA